MEYYTSEFSYQLAIHLFSSITSHVQQPIIRFKKPNIFVIINLEDIMIYIDKDDCVDVIW